MIKVLPNSFFKDQRNYRAWHMALCELGYSSRELPDVMTGTMLAIYHNTNIQCLHIQHWHHLTDDDARTLRNILKIDKERKPKHQSRNYDLLQYLSICLQFLDEGYASYVQDWCARQELCLDEDDDL